MGPHERTTMLIRTWMEDVAVVPKRQAVGIGTWARCNSQYRRQKGDVQVRRCEVGWRRICCLCLE